MKYKSNPQPVPSLPSWIPSPSGVSGITLPDDLTEDEIALAHVQSWPKAGIPDSGAHLDSPVKDTPAEVCKCRKCGSVHEWSARVKSHATFCPNCGDMMYDMIARPAPASPVDSVGVPELVLHAPLPWQREEDTIHDADGGLVAILSAEDCDFETLLANGDHIVTACNSHAAKDAKIKALEDAVKRLLDDPTIDCEIRRAEGEPNTAEFADWNARLLASVTAARAALALPCA